MEQTIVIYNDEGVGAFGLKCLQKFFAEDDVWLCNADAVIDGRVLEMADIFVMPGGADLPYCKKLNGQGNENIRNFVETGGTYLGVCAGAYYACREIAFHKGRPDEICGPRELTFVDALAVGSLPDLAPYYDLTLHSASIANIVLNDQTTRQVFYHGGCMFKPGNAPSLNLLARYADLPDKPAAVVETIVGEGKAILSGVHFEMTPNILSDHPTENSDERNRLAALMKDFTTPYASWKSLLGL